MTPERWQQIKEVFQSAAECAPETREAFLCAACAKDELLREEVEALLLSDEAAHSFIEQSPLALAYDVLSNVTAAVMIGRRLGSYRITAEISRGGMGVVYLAVRDDDEYQKRVAIKIIKRGIDTDEVLRRFRHERQILANLEHPNIARLVDGGNTDGLPYFVMEYIDGDPIDEYCDKKRFSTTERLKIFRTVCSAVHYAHQNLVIHRDLKPSNILVTAEGTPKLLDFGVAKLLHPEGDAETATHTALALRLMTPEYASPEQVRGGPITSASDVYSLGMLLYELLTGHRPYRLNSRWPLEIAQAVCEVEPEKPSTVVNRIEEVSNGEKGMALTPESVSRTRDGELEKLRRRLQGDIDNIVLMALRKEPERRYASVEQFSEDIRRHLEGLSVSARKERLAYGLAKFIQRNRTRVTAAGLILLTLLAGLLATIWQARIARREQAKVQALQAKPQAKTVLEGVGDYVVIATNDSLNPATTITLSGWFTTTPNGNYQFLINKFNGNNETAGKPPDDSYALGIAPRGRLYWQVETVEGNSVGDNLLYVTPRKTFTDGEFHHVVATYDGVLMRVYLDSVFVGSRPAKGPIQPSPTDLILGAGIEQDARTWFLKGLLDEVQIYDRALSSEEIRTLYITPTSTFPGLISWWRGDGDAKDSIGLNHGTIIGNVKFAQGKAGQAFSFGGY